MQITTISTEIEDITTDAIVIQRIINSANNLMFINSPP